MNARVTNVPLSEAIMRRRRSDNDSGLNSSVSCRQLSDEPFEGMSRYNVAAITASIMNAR